MSKLLLYEENNLLFDLNELINAADDDHSESRDVENAPLVSPQSTLTDLPLPPPPGLSMPNEPLKLSVIQEENPEKLVDYNHNVAERPEKPICLQSNPFLQDVYQTNTTADRVAIQLVITMWRSNLELQIPILKAYNGHLARMSSRTRVVPREMITRVEDATNNLISTLNLLTHFVNNVDNMSSDTAPLSADESTGCSAVPSFNAFAAPLNVSVASEFYTFPQTPGHEHNRTQSGFMSNNSVKRNTFDDAKQMETTFLNQNNNLHSTVLSRYDTSANGTLGFIDNDLGLSDIADRVQALTVDTNVRELNNISGAIDFSESISVESTPVRKETNPFKMNFQENENLLLNDTQRKTVLAPIASPKKSRNINKSNLSANQEKMALEFINTPRYELFADKHELGLNRNEPFAKIRPSGIDSPYNKTNTSKRNLFHAVEERTDNSSVVSCSYFTCDNQSSLPEVQDSTNINTTAAVQAPFSMPMLLSKVDNPNLDDEGYLTRPSTSDTLESSSPPGLTGELDSPDQNSSATPEQSSSISAEAWIKTIENAIALNSSLLKRPDDTLVPSNNTKCLISDINNSFNVANLCDKSESNNIIEPMGFVRKDYDEIDRKNLDDLSMRELNKTCNTDIENLPSTSSCTSSLYYQSVELTRGPMYVFHFEESGWMSADEFTENFTPFRTLSFMLNLKNILDVELSLREINRSFCPSVFAELDRSSLKAPRDSENKIGRISMISLRSGLRVLVKFNIIHPTDLKQGQYKEGSVLHDINTLISTYKDLKRRVNGGP